MTSFDLGDGVNLEHWVYDRNHQLTSATVALTVTAPDGQAFTPTITQPSTGQFQAATFAADQTGPWAYVWQVTGAVTDVVPGAFVVDNPGPLPYASLPRVKSALGKSTDDGKDDLLEQAIAAASRFIDKRCGRRFYADRTASARTFPIIGQSLYEGGEQVLLVDDISSLQDLAVATGTTGNWVTVPVWGQGPDNALGYGRPITQIRAGTGWLPATGRVQVTARWGWPAIPDEIAQATQLLAARLYRRKDSPEGVLGSSEWGAVRVSRIDPDVEALISPFVIQALA